MKITIEEIKEIINIICKFDANTCLVDIHGDYDEFIGLDKDKVTEVICYLISEKYEIVSDVLIVLIHSLNSECLYHEAKKSIEKGLSDQKCLAQIHKTLKDFLSSDEFVEYVELK